MIILAANFKISSGSLPQTLSLPAGVDLPKPCVYKWAQVGKLNILTTIFSIMWCTIRLVDLEMNQKHRKGYKKKQRETGRKSCGERERKWKGRGRKGESKREGES